MIYNLLLLPKFTVITEICFNYICNLYWRHAGERQITQVAWGAKASHLLTQSRCTGLPQSGHPSTPVLWLTPTSENPQKQMGHSESSVGGRRTLEKSGGGGGGGARERLHRRPLPSDGGRGCEASMSRRGRCKFAEGCGGQRFAEEVDAVARHDDAAPAAVGRLRRILFGLSDRGGCIWCQGRRPPPRDLFDVGRAQAPRGEELEVVDEPQDAEDEEAGVLAHAAEAPAVHVRVRARAGDASRALYRHAVPGLPRAAHRHAGDDAGRGWGRGRSGCSPRALRGHVEQVKRLAVDLLEALELVARGRGGPRRQQERGVPPGRTTRRRARRRR